MDLPRGPLPAEDSGPSLSTVGDAPASIDAKARLIAGADMWTTLADPPTGIRALCFTDGPCGVRSPGFDERDTAWCTPCGAALGASWDARLAQEIGEFIGREARRRSVDVVLAPVLNLPRSPLGGRNFECVSEDPILAGSLAAAWITGVQRQGVSACPKHFVGNDTETSRTTVDCIIDDRALHEIYLRAFELAVAAGPWAIMAAYNRVNGTYASEHIGLLQRVLRDRWDSDALVVSDWTGARNTIACALAGLDLEMPGPPRIYGAALADAVRCGAVPEAVLDDKVAQLARLSRRTTSTGVPPIHHGPCAPPSIHGRRPPPELLTRAAAAGFVLLKNDAALLPFDRHPRVLAVLGPNAFDPCFQGYGSSMVSMGPTVDPLSAIADRFAGTRMLEEQGCSASYTLRGLDRLSVTTPDASCLPGLRVEYFRRPDVAATPAAHEVRRSSLLIWGQRLPAVPQDEPALVRVSTILTPDRSGRHTFSLRGSGPTRILVDQTEIASLPAQSGPHDIIAAWFSDEVGEGCVHLQAGSPVLVEIEMRCEPGMYHLLLFGCRPPDRVDLLDRAVAAARAADAVVLMVGTDHDVETESRDRITTSLPSGQDELVERVLEANTATAVIVNAGRALALPWAERATTILYSWLPGHGFGPALAGVLAGDLEPNGRLPISIAASADDYPAYNTIPDSEGRLHYRESHLVGYRGLDAAGATPAFCFGHGIGYTQFTYEQLTTSTSHLASEQSLTAAVTVRNTGSRTGKEIIQLYISGPREGVPRPPLQLVAFSTVTLAPGESAVADLHLDHARLAYWDTNQAGWAVESGDYGLHVGRSSRDIRLTTTVRATGGRP